MATLNSNQSINTRFSMAPNIRLRHLTPILLYAFVQLFPLVIREVRPEWLTETFIGLWMAIGFTVTIVLSLLLIWPDLKQYKAQGVQSNLNDTVKWIGLGILMQYGLVIVANLIETAISGELVESMNTQTIADMVEVIPLMILPVILLGPIIEEILFRHILFGNLNVRFGFWIAFAVSSILFALIHQDNRFLVYIAMSFAFSYAYAKTRRLIVPIAIHAFNNALVMLVLFLM
ncbi:CPBP family intramembrane glutamic endopeptidase [Exiguobacterium aestuarii]|uniref:CPBP family intramembrane glutamic endopeptidase n=2 Tax=Exiguobacterium TaxID=33986 RepID=A0ABW2PRD4_9BACL|nr:MULTISPECIES: type II CAAX endopeptidase family protein [Exiguobacterium]MCT4786359.1 CPBP family intramembrane metalloprotease [Exiguobacterium aestuarii]